MQTNDYYYCQIKKGHLKKMIETRNYISERVNGAPYMLFLTICLESNSIF